MSPRLPHARGPLSAALLTQLRGPVGATAPDVASRLPIVDATEDDFQLALYVCYELHYRGFAEVDEDWEWEPSLLALRGRLEDRFVRDLVGTVGRPTLVTPTSVGPALRKLIDRFDGPSLSTWMEQHGDIDAMREFAIHRSAYQRKEADPHTWAIPRLDGTAKAALITIQADEYGGGSLAAMHSELFTTTMRTLGLDPTYGAYLDRLPGVTLATVNLVSLFGLHRRWRGALIGHLAVFEMCSVVPMSRYANALRRLGLGDEAAGFYDVHVEADAVHEVIASTDLAMGFAEAEPARAGDVLFGARALMAIEDRLARHLLAGWQHHRSTLLPIRASRAA
jgi:hypothetical protein